MPDERFPDENIHMSVAPGTDGGRYSPTGLGYSLSLIPAVFLEDMVLKISGSLPTTAFPLDNDWPVLLFASMTNAFWGAVVTLVLALFLMEFAINKKRAMILSLLLVGTSNILPYTKHSFAQMMFSASLLVVFYFTRRAVVKKNALLAFHAGFWYGIVALSYNPTFLLVIPALAIYAVAVWRYQNKFLTVSNFLKLAGYGVIGALPLLLTYWWFNAIRFGGHIEGGYSGGVAQSLSFPPLYVIIEGFWGLLFSPGKSIFLYSPLLISLFLFWFKIPKKVMAETLAGSALFVIYLWFIGTLLGAPDFLVWHGDSSWGPRYLLPVLPLLLVVVGVILDTIGKRYIAVFSILILLGLWINLIGILLPYQIRFAGLQTDVYFNGRNFNVYEYGNEIPRYAPFFTQSKHLVRRLIDLPKTYGYGEFSTKLVDGFGDPYIVGNLSWRGVKDRAVIRFDKPTQLSEIRIVLANHQSDPTSSQSAQVAVSMLNKKVEVSIPPNEGTEVTLNVEKTVDTSPLNLYLEATFESSSAASLSKKQIIFLQSLKLNNQSQSLHTINYPYVTSATFGAKKPEYVYWGAYDTNPWSIWHMHSIVYEKTIDLWWIRLRHYWDIPQGFVTILVAINGVILIWSGCTICIIREKRH